MLQVPLRQLECICSMTLKKNALKFIFCLTFFAPLFGSTSDPLPIAHRGASFYRPENTLEAFQLAYQMGAKALEFDCWLSKDGEIVISHDQGLERTTNLSGKISDFDLCDLQKVDVGSWFHPSYSNVQMPTLIDVLEFSKNKNLILFIELKDPNLKIVQKTSKLLEEYEMIDQAYIISFEHHLLTYLHKNYPHLHFGISYKNISEDILSKSLEMGAEGLILPYHKVDKPLVDKIQKQGLKVWFYGGCPGKKEDHLTKVNKSLTCGVDGYFTNFSELN